MKEAGSWVLLLYTVAQRVHRVRLTFASRQYNLPSLVELTVASAWTVFFIFKIFYAKKHTGFTTNSARLIKRCLPRNKQTNKAVKKTKCYRFVQSMHAVTTECRYTNGAGGF